MITSCYNKNMEFDPKRFRDFIRDKFAEWRGKGRGTLGEYATYLRISPQNLSNWYNGKFKRRPTADTYLLLIEKYGPEVYDILGLPRSPASNPLAGLPPELAADVDATLEELRSSGVNKGKENASPEDEEMIRAILLKHLGKYMATTKD